MSILSHKITKDPGYVDRDIMEKKKSMMIEADDNFSVINYSLKKGGYIGVGLFMLITYLIALFLGGGEGAFSLEEILVAFFWGGIGLFIIIFNLFRKKKTRHLRMDRQNGLVTLAPWNKSPASTFPFNQLVGENVFTTTTDAVAYENLHVYQRDVEEVHNIAELCADEIWSLMVWYMDKNRPLPKGTAYDPYRQQDYERRKAEGFPKPLYPSDVPTPEATPAQQREREKYWRD